MLFALLCTLPVALALWLLTFHGGIAGSWNTRERAGVVAGGAIVLGPLALTLLGLLAWLLVLAFAMVALTTFASLRRRQPVRTRRDGSPLSA